MCSQCPRSYCNNCLSRVLTHQQIEELEVITDWVCMCCLQNIPILPPHMDDSDLWVIVKPTKSNTYRQIGKKIIHNTNNDDSNSDSKQIDSNMKDDCNTLRRKNDEDEYDQLSMIQNEMERKEHEVLEANDQEMTLKLSLKNLPDIPSPSCDRNIQDINENEKDSMEDNPYLDDFDDHSSNDENTDEKGDKNDGIKDDNEDDADCNLFITLPQKYFPKKVILDNTKKPEVKSLGKKTKISNHMTNLIRNKPDVVCTRRGGKVIHNSLVLNNAINFDGIVIPKRTRRKGLIFEGGICTYIHQ